MPKILMMEHERDHTANKPYKCTIYNKAFIIYCEWVKHERVHTDGSP